MSNEFMPVYDKVVNLCAKIKHLEAASAICLHFVKSGLSVTEENNELLNTLLMIAALLDELANTLPESEVFPCFARAKAALVANKILFEMNNDNSENN